ncbi:MAG: hypothetical protein OYM47_19370 [Gemmatimonadota bacterium]|nr:hypothetical protein [Gemmatimonadota bacterium]
MEAWENLRSEGKSYIWTALKLQDYMFGVDHIPQDAMFGLSSKLDKNFPGKKEWCHYRGPLEFQHLWESLFNDPMQTGCSPSDIVLLSLGIEMCLKSIFLLEEKSKPKPDHDLYGHFDVLKDETKEVLREKYVALFLKLNIPQNLRENWLKFDIDKIDVILKEHRNAFKDLRYRWEWPRGTGYGFKPLCLRMAALVIVDYITNSQ